MSVHAALVDRFELRLKQVNPQYESLQYDISDLVSCCNAMCGHRIVNLCELLESC